MDPLQIAGLAISNKKHPSGKRARWQTSVWALVALGIALLLIGYGIPAADAAVDWIRALADNAVTWNQRMSVYLVAAAFTFLTVFLPFPAEASAFLNGALFQPAVAFALTWGIAMIAAAASYEIGRMFGRRPAERIFGSAAMHRVEGLIGTAGWPALLALRLSPVMAFTAINWASGILALSRSVFYWTTAVGLVPGTYLFTVVPEVLHNGASTMRIVLMALAVMIGLLSISVVRFRHAS